MKTASVITMINFSPPGLRSMKRLAVMSRFDDIGFRVGSSPPILV